jgi:hypothetical protein
LPGAILTTDSDYKHMNGKGGACAQSSSRDRANRAGSGRAERDLGSSTRGSPRADHRSAQPPTGTLVRSRKESAKRRKEQL